MFPDDHDYFPASELQNAFARSQQEFTDDKGKVDELRHLGRWVVVASGPAYCPSTDAIMGTRVALLGDFANADEAETFASGEREHEHEEYRVEVQPPIYPKTEAPPALTDDDIPF